jgi:cytochrome c biogenesis protein CcmG/thiol:disulfide interchange protein DsbE
MVPLDELEKPPRPRWRAAFLLLPAVGFVALLWFGLQRSDPNVEAESRAPAFELPRLEGGSLSSSDLEGRPVVVNFWASWCIPCRDEAPLLERTWREYQDDGVVIVGINIKDSVTAAREFVDEFDITYPIVRDETGELERDFGLTGLPETFFIDHEWRFIGSASGSEVGASQGIVVLGAISEDQLTTNIEILLRRAAGSAGEQGGDSG